MVLCAMLTIVWMALVTGNLFGSEQKREHSGVCQNNHRRLLSDSYSSHGRSGRLLNCFGVKRRSREVRSRRSGCTNCFPWSRTQSSQDQEEEEGPHVEPEMRGIHVQQMEGNHVQEVEGTQNEPEDGGPHDDAEEPRLHVGPEAEVPSESLAAPEELMAQLNEKKRLRRVMLYKRLQQIVHHANRQERASLDGTRPGSLVSIYFNPKYDVHRFRFNIAEDPEEHRRFFDLDIIKEFKIMKIAAQFARDTEISLPVEIIASAAGFRGIWTDPNQKQIELTMEIVTGTDGAAEWLKISWDPQQFRLIDIHWTHEFIALLN